MTAALRVVLIGAGARAQKLYVPWLSGQPPFPSDAARPVAVLDADLDCARSLAADLPSVLATRPPDLERVLADTRPDLVVVATPDATHRTYAERALAAGCSTLVEKPLATTIADASALVRTADASPARLLVAHNLRFTNIHTRVHQLLRERRIGTVVSADFHYTLNHSHAYSYFTRWHRTRAASGGLEVTKASHHLDLLTWWLAARPVAVTAVLEHRHYRPGAPNIPPDSDIHDTIHALIEYNSGATVHYELTVNAPRDGYTCTLHGTEGTCRIRYDARSGPHIVHLNTLTDHIGVRHRLTREDGSHAGADRRMLAALPTALAPDAAQQHFATAAEAAMAVATGVTMHNASSQSRRLPIPQPTTTGEPT
ncbi:Gfo/Idh/MocA family protein [Nocardia sp. CA-107356]|uniref:Gfo/Idh/MocA family protein n=1 Tax=Nocardia sp. CA-107356 TaxID=3239972 RepID=UPI003D90ED6B